MRWSKLLVVGLSVFSLIACEKDLSNGSVPTTNSATTLTGNYTISEASNPGNKGSYQGNVVIKELGAYHTLQWTIGGAEAYGGVALKDDKYLGVGWGITGNYGVVVYDVVGGTLNGKWAVSNGNGKLGTEVLKGPETLDGTFKIVEATGPSGTYGGTVTIKPTGDTYQFEWTIGASSYKGVGIKEGDTMYVGWSVGKQAGVVLYALGELGRGKLDGKWAQPGGTQLGRELLTTTR